MTRFPAAVLPLGAVFDLSGRPTYVHWHFFQMSVSNLLVIVLMIVVFWLAVLLPFPRSGGPYSDAGDS